MNWQFEQRVDLQHPSGVVSYPDPLMAQGDNLAHTWRVQVTMGGQPMDLTGYGVVGYFDRSDGKMVPVIGSAVGHVASVVLPQSVCVAAGPLTGLLRASKDGQIVTLAAGRWNVRRGPGDEIVDPGHVVPSLEELLAKIGEMENATAAANTAADAANQAAQGIQGEIDELKSGLSGIVDNSVAFAAASGETMVPYEITAGRMYQFVISDPAGGAVVTIVSTGSGATETLLNSVLAGMYYVQPTISNTMLYTNATAQVTVTAVEASAVPIAIENKADRTDIDHRRTITLDSKGTYYPDFAVRSGHSYMMRYSGAGVSANIRVGIGTKTVGELFVGENSNQYCFADYSGPDGTNLIVYTSGATTLEITDLDAVKSTGDGRIYVDVSNVNELILAVKYSNTHRMTISLMPGTYDLIAGFGADYFDNAPEAMFGLVLGNDVVINGNPRALITAEYEGSNPNAHKYFSVFNTGPCVEPYNIFGGFTLSGVNIRAKNIRYVIHDEHNQSVAPYTNCYRNCHMALDNDANSDWQNWQIIGGGLGANGVIDIEGCVFESTAHAARTSVVNYHNSAHPQAKSFVRFCGNVVKPKNALFGLSYHGTSSQKTTALIFNNLWGGVMSYGATLSSDTVDNFELRQWNNAELGTDLATDVATLKDAVATLKDDVAYLIRDTAYDSMSQIADVVRGHTLEENARIFPIGDQIIMPWKDMDDPAHNTDETAYPVEWDIVHHGLVTLQDGSVVPGMFLMMHKCSAYGVQFNHPQAFLRCPDGLAAGTYHVTFGATWGNYAIKGAVWQFTLTQAVPAGGMLSGFESMQKSASTNWRVKSWTNAADAGPIETVAVTSGNGGTDLGTMPLIAVDDTGLNGMQQVAYGSNRWSTSAIRQYLNSAGADWFSCKENLGIRPNQYNKQGFMSGFNADFLSAIKPVKVTTALNEVEGFTDAAEDTFDTFFLPSLEQINATPQLPGAEGDYFEYWRRRLGLSGFANWTPSTYEGYKIPAINDNSPQYVRLRSAYRGGTFVSWFVCSTGYIHSGGYGNGGAIAADYRFSPVCVIC